MADIKKKGFRTVETNFEELDKQIREHKKQMLKRGIKIVVVIIAIVLIVELVYALRSFDSYEVQESLEQSGSVSAQYAGVDGDLIEYSNDGVSRIGSDGEIVWNQSFEMSDPNIVTCGDYIAVYDVSGSDIYILTKSGVEERIQMSSPIQTVCIAEQGTIAVLMKEDLEYQVKLFDKKGNELANGKFYGEKGGFPIDIALSYDATKLAVDMIDVTDGKVNTTISFYNFGTVGQSEVDNIVGTYTFENVLVPEIDYISDARMIGLGTGVVYVFEGSQKPELKKEIAIEEEVLSYFHNDNYIGIVYNNVEMDNSWNIKVIDMRGNVVMENNTSIAYENVEFLEDNEVCVTGETECEIFTIQSIKKFYYEFDKELYKVLSRSGQQNYTFVFKDTIEEVKLK